VKLNYMAVPMKRPVPALGSQSVRNRPVVAVLLTGSATPQLRDGLLDTGADDTVFSDPVAAALGADLSHAKQCSISLAGRAQPLVCGYTQVQLRITDGIEIFEWPAVVGFVSARLHYALLADFDGDDHVVELIPKPSFPGRRV
jgi:hypothetical protein